MPRKVAVLSLFVVSLVVVGAVFASHATVLCSSQDPWCQGLVQHEECQLIAEHGDWWEVWCGSPDDIPSSSYTECRFDINGPTPYDGACEREMRECELVGVQWLGGSERLALFICPAIGASAPEVPYLVQNLVRAMDDNWDFNLQMSTYVGNWHLEQQNGVVYLVQIEEKSEMTSVHLYNPETFVQVTYWDTLR